MRLHMTIYDRKVDADLERFLSTAPRYRVVVTKWNEKVKEEKAVNIGREMASVISGLDRNDSFGFSFFVEEAFRRTIKKNTFSDEKYGNVVVMENVGILFEPELGLNFTELLKSISKNTLVVLLWPGEMGWERLYFLNRNSNVFINQSEINYFIL